MAGGLVLAVAAWRAARGPGGFYDRTLYGMTPRTHRIYLAIGLVFAGIFAFTFTRHVAAAEFGALAALAIIGVFYATSFLRGYSEHDE